MIRLFDFLLDLSIEILDIYCVYMLEFFFLVNKVNMCSLLFFYMELKELVDRFGEICKV